MKRCYYCGTENDDALATCQACGGKLLVSARPKARFFGFLALFWAPVALVGALLLWLDTWGTESVEIRRLVWLVLIPELVFIGLAIVFQFVERPRKVPEPRHWDRPVID
jgi:hypothetical protein